MHSSLHPNLYLKFVPLPRKKLISDAHFQTQDSHIYEHSTHQKMRNRDIVFRFFFNMVSGKILQPSKIALKRHIHINVSSLTKILRRNKQNRPTNILHGIFEGGENTQKKTTSEDQFREFVDEIRRASEAIVGSGRRNST